MADFSLTEDGAISFQKIKIYHDSGKNRENYSERSDVFYMDKHVSYIDLYKQVLQSRPTGFFKNIFEIGVWKGGSAIFLHQLFEPAVLSCVDLTKRPILALDRYIQEERVHNILLHLGQDQADKGGLRRVIGSDFRGPIDLVVDDASHFYEQTRATFEAVFPQLRRGGIYVIEDWGWAHGQREKPYASPEKSPLPLITELLILQASQPATIEDIRIPFRGLLYLVRGSAPLGPSFSLPRAEGASGRPSPISWPWRKRSQ